MVDVEQLKAVDPGLIQGIQIFGGDFIARFDINPARLLVDQVERRIPAENFFGRDQQAGQAILHGLIGRAWGNLGAGREYNFARLGIDNVEHRF